MAEKQESRIGMLPDGSVIHVFCGGKIGLNVGGSSDKENPYVWLNIGELTENVGIAGDVKDVGFNKDCLIIRVVFYDIRSIDVFIKKFEEAKKKMNDILEYNKKVDEF